MVSRRKLEEEIARSKDPVLRKQLQELLEKRNQKWTEKEKKAKDFFNTAAEQLSSILEGLPKFFCICVWAAIVIGLIFLLIMWLAGEL